MRIRSLIDLNVFFDAEFDEHEAVVSATRQALVGPFRQLVGNAVEAIKGGNKILFFGNGGSAADCQHLATELTIRYKTDRAPIPAIASESHHGGKPNGSTKNPARVRGYQAQSAALLAALRSSADTAHSGDR